MKQSSTTITQNQAQSHVKLSLWVRYVPIPTEWYVLSNPHQHDDSPDEQYLLVPAVNQSRATRQESLDPFALRSEFLKLDVDNQAKTIAFLNRVGVWNIDQLDLGEPAQSRRIDRAVGHRHVIGYATLFTVGELKRVQQRAELQLLNLRKNPKSLIDLFGPPPRAERELEHHVARNRALNTLPLHLEWHKHPEGVIQPVTGHEMLNVTLQLDLMRTANVHVCDYCEHPFTGKSRAYCSDSCMRARAQRVYREKNPTGRWRTT